MSTWDEIHCFLRALYRPVEDTGDSLKIYCNAPGVDKQLMVIEHLSDRENTEGAWITVLSPIGSAHYVDLSAVLARTANRYAIGGVVQIGDILYIRHSIPLPAVSIDAFVCQFQAVMFTATRLTRDFACFD